MKPNLLHDVLTEGDYTAFREDLLRRTTATARRNRIARAARHFALAASIALIAVLLLAPRHLHRNGLSPASVSVQNAAASAGSVAILRTKPLDPSQILETHVCANLVVIATDQSHRLRSISDDELLGLFPHHSRGLASTWQGIKRFFFVDPADAKTFTSSN